LKLILKKEEKELDGWFGRKKELLKSGGEKAVEKQHSKGKLTARERINLLVNPGSFQEYGLFVRIRPTYYSVIKGNH